MVTNPKVIPMYITFFRPMVSDSFPEKGLEIAAENENIRKMSPL